MLTSAQIAFYNKNGYLAIENVLSEAAIEKLRQVTDNFVEMSRSVTENTSLFGLEPGHSPDAPELRRLKEPTRQHSVYDQMMRHKKILDMVVQLIGPAIRLNGDKLNLKSPGVGSPVEWHQDLLAVAVVMDDMMLENGCLLVMPGSHKGPIYDHHQEGVFVGAVTSATFDTRQVVPLELNAGGITIHHVRTLHASAANISERSRRLLFFEYSAVDAWPLLGVADLPAYDARIIVGQPTREPRLEAAPVRIPMPAPEELQSSIYDLQTQLKQSTLEV